MQVKTNRLVVLLEMENGDVHQVIMTKEQERAVKGVLQAVGKTIQVMSTPLETIKIEKE